MHARGRPRSRRATPSRSKTVDWPLYGYDDAAHPLPADQARAAPVRRLGVELPGRQAARVLADRRQRDALLPGQGRAASTRSAPTRARSSGRSRSAPSAPPRPPTRTASSTRSRCSSAPGVDQGEALALRAKDGKLLWRFALPGRSETSPIVVGSNVIVGSESGDVYALDRKTGKVDWQVHTAGAVKGGLALDDGVLYGANYAGQVFAIEASNGQYVWQSSTQGLELRPRRAGLLDARRSPSAASSSAASTAASTASTRTPASCSGATRPATGSTPRRRSPTRRRPSRPSTSARRTRTSTRSTRRPASVRWQKDIGGVILGAASVLGEIVYVAGLGPERRHLRLRRQDRQEGLRVRARRVQPGDLRRPPDVPDRASSSIRAFEHETDGGAEAQARRHRRAGTSASASAAGAQAKRRRAPAPGRPHSGERGATA